MNVLRIWIVTVFCRPCPSLLSPVSVMFLLIDEELGVGFRIDCALKRIEVDACEWFLLLGFVFVCVFLLGFAFDATVSCSRHVISAGAWLRLLLIGRQGWGEERSGRDFGVR